MMTKLEEKLKNGFNLDLGKLLEESFEYFKKTVWISGLATILLVLVMCVLYFGIFAIVFGLSDMTNLVAKINLNQSTPLFVIGYLLISVILSSFIHPIYAGFINVNHIAKQNNSIELGDYFLYFKGKHMKDLILLGAVTGFTSVIISTGFESIGYQFIGIVFQILIGLFTVYSTSLIIYQDTNYWQSILKSMELFIKQPFIIIIALLVAYILAMFGLIALCIGIFFTLPFIWSMYYAIYSQTFGFEEKSEIDEIGTSFE